MTLSSEWSSRAVAVLRECLADHLVEGIAYEKLGEEYEMTLLVDGIESWEEHLIASEHGLYDHAVVDSDVERKLVVEMEARDDVKLYVKLPGWFTVSTPVGEYNPDWAVVIEERDEHGEAQEMLYLVGETKGTKNLDELRPSERRKVSCGRQHFNDALDVPFGVGTTLKDVLESAKVT